MSFKLNVRIEENSDVLKNLKETDDVYEYMCGYLDFVLNENNFLSNIKPTQISVIFTEIYHTIQNSTKFKIPFFSFLFDLGRLELYGYSYDRFEITEDFISFSYVLINDGESSNIFLHSESEDAWYDGKNVFYSRETPINSNFRVPNKELFSVLNTVLQDTRSEISEKYPNLSSNIYVKRSFTPII